jgi:hypothetical protein
VARPSARRRLRRRDQIRERPESVSLNLKPFLWAIGHEFSSWPSSTHESRLWRDGVTSFSCSGTSPGPSTGAEPGISVERNRCAALMAKRLAKAVLAARRIGGETELCRLLDFKAGYGQLGEEE